MHSPGIKASSWPLVRRNIESKTNGGNSDEPRKKGEWPTGGRNAEESLRHTNVHQIRERLKTHAAWGDVGA